MKKHSHVFKGGIIGFGGMGQHFAGLVNKRIDARITVVFDNNTGKKEIAVKKFGLDVSTSAEELFKADIDFVIIATTSNVHKELVLLAAKYKKHILCEKPIALNLRDADEMLKAVKKANVITVVNYSFRYGKINIKMKEMIEAGKIGKVLSFWMTRFRGYGLYSGGSRHYAVIKPELSGGWIVHHACHSVDFMIWMLGKVKNVYCLTKSTVPRAASEEIIWCLLNFQNGAVGMLGDSITSLRENSYGVIGDKGTLCVTSTTKGNVLLFRKEENKECYNLVNKKDIVEIKNEGSAGQKIVKIKK